MRIRLQLSCLLVGVVLVVAFAGGMSGLAMDYFVDGVGGDDGNSGLSAGNAWKTITHALGAAAATEGDPAIINVAAGTYSASTNGEVFPLAVNSYVALRGDVGDVTVLDAERSSGLIQADHVSAARIENLSLTRAARHPAIDCTSSFITVTGCHISQSRGASAVQNGSSYPYTGELVLNHCTIKNNQCGENTCIYGYTRLKITSTAIQGNAAAWLLFSLNLTVRHSLIEGNSGTVITSYSPLIEDTIIRNNQGDYLLDLDRFEGVFRRCVIDGNETQGALFDLFGSIGFWTYIPRLEVEDSLVVGNISSQAVLISTVDQLVVRCKSSARVPVQDDDERIVLRRCIIEGNRGQERLSRTTHDPVGGDRTGGAARIRIQDCILWGNQLRLDRHSETGTGSDGDIKWPYNVDHSCLEIETVQGEGNFVAHPLFVSGPLGDYYLSSVGAGQDADSPCIDAGSTSASIAGVGKLTTRTDGAFDAGVLDIGYHYSATPPTIECEVSDGSDALTRALDAQPFAPGDTLSASIRIENGGLPHWVDTYAGFILPDGSIYCITPDGLTTDLVPWAAAAHLPTDFVSGDIAVFEAQLPEGLQEGAYTFAAALSLTGPFRPIGDIAFAGFTLQ